MFSTPHHSINKSINLLFKVQSHQLNALRTLQDNNINTLLKKSDTDITEWTEIEENNKLQQGLT